MKALCVLFASFSVVVSHAALAQEGGEGEGRGGERASRTATDEARAQLGDGERRYVDLDFQGAVDALQRVLAVPGVRDAERLDAYEYLGACYVILDRDDDAREAFSAMLRLDPYHALREPTGSPKIAHFVEALRREIAPDAALDSTVHLTLELPRAMRAGAPGRATVRAPDAGGKVARVTLFVRGATDDAYEPIACERVGAAFTATIPAHDGGDELEVYAEARDAEDRVVSRAGEPLAPLSLAVRVETTPPRHGENVVEQWWFWAIIGGAIAIGVGIAVGLTVGVQTAAPDGSLPPGRVVLPLAAW